MRPLPGHGLTTWKLLRERSTGEALAVASNPDRCRPYRVRKMAPAPFRFVPAAAAVDESAPIDSNEGDGGMSHGCNSRSAGRCPRSTAYCRSSSISRLTTSHNDSPAKRLAMEISGTLPPAHLSRTNCRRVYYELLIHKNIPWVGYSFVLPRLRPASPPPSPRIRPKRPACAPRHPHTHPELASTPCPPIAPRNKKC